MTSKPPIIDTSLYNYALNCGLKETAEQKALRKASPKHPRMISSPDQAQFIAFLARIFGAQRLIEVGVFTGYTTLTLAQSLPETARIIACDRGEDWPNIGKTYWESAKVAHKIDFRRGLAAETLADLCDCGGMNYFDFIFIDADKRHYRDYYELSLALLRPGGLLVLDDALWVGDVPTPSASNPGTRTVDALNRSIKDDTRVAGVLLPFHAGLWVLRKN